LDKHPDYVIKRYESGGVATNAECDAIYAQALQRLMDNNTGGASNSSYRRAETGRSSLPTSMARLSPEPLRSGPGMKGNPVHVVVDEGNSDLDNGLIL
jgi:hypothetical protein